MKKLILQLVFATASIFAIAPTYALTYYVSGCDAGAMSACVPGNDSYTTTQAQNPATPWLTAKTAISSYFNILNGGDSILLARGGSWLNTTTSNLSAKTGVTGANPVTIGAYTPTWASFTDSGTAPGGSTTTLVDTSKSWTPSALIGYSVRVSFLGRPQQWNIAANTSNTITLVTRPSPDSPGWTASPGYQSGPAGLPYTIQAPRPKLRAMTGSQVTSGSYTIQFAQGNGGSINKQGQAIRGIDLDGAADNAVAISSLVVTGSVATITTVSPHGITGSGFPMTVWGSSLSGSNVFTGLNSGTVVTGANTITYPCNSCTVGTSTGTPAYVIQAQTGVAISSNTAYNTLDDLDVHGYGVPIQIQGVNFSYVTPVGQTGDADHTTLTNSTIHAGSICLLIGANDLFLANLVTDHCGASLYDHNLYIGAESHPPLAPVSISSLVGDGTTAVLTTSTPHGGAVGNLYGSDVNIHVAGAGSFNTTQSGGIITSPTTVKYPSTATGSATLTGVTYSIAPEIFTKEMIVRNVLFTNSNYGAEGLCATTTFVVHGYNSNLLLEDSDFFEPTLGSGGCFGFFVSNGVYTATGGYPIREEMRNIEVRNTRFINYGISVMLDNCTYCSIHDNYIYTNLVGAEGGIMTPQDYHPFVLTDGKTMTTNTSIYNNTVDIRRPSNTSFGIEIVREGVGHKVFNNLINFGNMSTSTTACFNTDTRSGSVHNDSTYWLAPSALALMDYNSCFFESGTMGVWSNDGGSPRTRAQHGTWSGSSADAHSLDNSNCATGSVLTNAPLGPNTGTTTCVKHMGHPTLSDKSSFGNILRSSSGGLGDIGAFQFGASGVLPHAPSRLGSYP